MEILGFGSGPEQPLGRFVEFFGDMVEHAGRTVLRRTSEFLFQKLPRSAADENGTREKTWNEMGTQGR